MDSEDKDAVVNDDKDRPVVTNPILAHARKWTAESGKTIRIMDKILVDLIHDPFSIDLANALQILSDRLLVVDSIFQGTPSSLCWIQQGSRYHEDDQAQPGGLQNLPDMSLRLL